MLLGRQGGKLGGFSPICKAHRLRQELQADGPVPRKRILQEIQQIWDPNSFARVVFMAQICGCVQLEALSSIQV